MTDSAAGRRGQGESEGVSRRIHGHGGSQPGANGSGGPYEYRPRRRAARRARDPGQDPARHPARPQDQGGLHRRDRGRQARGLPEPELHRRLRALLRALPVARPGRGLSPLLPGERLRRPEAVGHGASRPRAGATAQPLAGGFRPDFPLARLAQRAGCRRSRCRRSARCWCSAALVVGLGYGGWTVLQNIQRVQFAPVEELPLAVAEVGPLDPPDDDAAGGAGA